MKIMKNMKIFFLKVWRPDAIQLFDAIERNQSKEKMSRVKIASPESYRSLSPVHDNEHGNEHDNNDDSDSDEIVEEINAMKSKYRKPSVADSLITIFDQHMAVQRQSEVRRRSPKVEKYE